MSSSAFKLTSALGVASKEINADGTPSALASAFTTRRLGCLLPIQTNSR